MELSHHKLSQDPDKAPTVGRLYHHLAILARPKPVAAAALLLEIVLCGYPLSLGARDGIIIVFDPIMS